MSDKEKLDPKIEKEVKRQLEILSFGVTEIVPEDEFEKMLRKSITDNVPLRVKCGIDPTSKDVHLGHLVPYRKMREFQDLGHSGVVIIGDYTASIGDPTGKNESRPALNKDTIKKNADTYMEQVFTVLDRDKTEIRYQTEWFKNVTLYDVLTWASQTTVAKLLSHETFSERIDNNNSLGLHEMFYPVLQGMDSVYINADVELGGTDQRFNVLMGRDYQRARGTRPQVAMLLPIIIGTCGKEKMSKSLGNYIGINDIPFDKFGKTMSIPDDLMLDYYKYTTDIKFEEFQKLEKEYKDGTLHPNEMKKRLATRVVSFFHGEEEAKKMREKFESVFAKGKAPDDAQEFEYKRGDTLSNILVSSGQLASKGEARRLVKQKAVGVMGEDKFSDAEVTLDESYAGKMIKIGKKKFLKLK